MPETTPAAAAAPLLDDETARRQLATGLTKIALAIRHHAWLGGESASLTPTQGQVLAILASACGRPMRISDIAAQLAVAQPTATVAVQALERKGLIERHRVEGDRRAVGITLSPAGVEAARRSMSWADFLVQAIDTLEPAEQAACKRAIVKLVRTLQERGEIPISRMCVTCTYFRPNQYADAERPHHCAFVDAPFGDRHLRLDCLDHRPADPDQAASTWAAFAGAGPG